MSSDSEHARSVVLDAVVDRTVGLPVSADTGTVVVGCSGGADSTLALAVAVHAGLEAMAVHVDHGLRSGSDAEADHVRRSASDLDARFRSVSVDLDDGPNLEARARDARRSALAGVAREIDAGAILLGHTMDDQAETVLLALLRGAAGTGLGAMAPVSVHADGPTLHRPLLTLRRAETRGICARLGLEVLDDPMNDDTRFRRVWIRHEVLPRLSDGAGRDLVPVLARQADVLRAESSYLDALAEASWPGTDAKAAELALLDPVLARRAVRRWIGPPPPRLDEVERILAVAGGDRRATDLAGGRRVWRRGGVMYHGTPGSGRDYVGDA